ncbi:MAG: 30S ribosomal protein S18 [Candidatus Margulisbacteria bacterium]|nr:30S ribosomal protein S18 [Candidatus Margulisiibacteriota bacterium]
MAADQEQKVFVKRRMKRRKVCFFCAEKIEVLDYKDTQKFRRFLTDRGKIVPKRNSGVCAKHQRMVATAIKRARYIGVLPYTMD